MNKKIFGEDNNSLSSFDLKPITLLDEVRAGGRVSLIIGKGLTENQEIHLEFEPSKIFTQSIGKDQKNMAFPCTENSRKGLWC